jgi:hypothetical protein
MQHDIEEPSDVTWITVFGYKPEQAVDVLHHFSQYGGGAVCTRVDVEIDSQKFCNMRLVARIGCTFTTQNRWRRQRHWRVARVSSDPRWCVLVGCAECRWLKP